MEVQQKGRPAEKEKRSPGGAARSVLAERESNGRRRREGQTVWSLGVAGLWGAERGEGRWVFGGDTRPTPQTTRVYGRRRRRMAQPVTLWLGD